MVPPHVVAPRRHALSSSMLEGAGRTLKGRDLRRVRNAVLRQTGFLDLWTNSQIVGARSSNQQASRSLPSFLLLRSTSSLQCNETRPELVSCLSTPEMDSIHSI
jgi:hypothetical protein